MKKLFIKRATVTVPTMAPAVKSRTVALIAKVAPAMKITTINLQSTII
ncbi:MAG: hypothetical protein J5995_07040 [Muribaculaceae bacterium]|nr:hypothetical protein [Muribaculaceae bacterium]